MPMHACCATTRMHWHLFSAQNWIGLLLRHKCAPNGPGYSLCLGHQSLELLDSERLSTVFQRFVRIWMHLDQQAIGSCGDRGQGHWSNEITSACTLAGVRD